LATSIGGPLSGDREHPQPGGRPALDVEFFFGNPSPPGQNAAMIA